MPVDGSGRTGLACWWSWKALGPRSHLLAGLTETIAAEAKSPAFGLFRSESVCRSPPRSGKCTAAANGWVWLGLLAGGAVRSCWLSRSCRDQNLIPIQSLMLCRNRLASASVAVVAAGVVARLPLMTCVAAGRLTPVVLFALARTCRLTPRAETAAFADGLFRDVEVRCALVAVALSRAW